MKKTAWEILAGVVLGLVTVSLTAFAADAEEGTESTGEETEEGTSEAETVTEEEAGEEAADTSGEG